MKAKSRLVFILLLWRLHLSLVKCNYSLYTALCCSHTSQHLHLCCELQHMSQGEAGWQCINMWQCIYMPEHAAGLGGRQPAAWSPIVLVWQHITAIRRCRIQNIQVAYAWSICTLFLMLVGLPLENGALVHVQTSPLWMKKIAKSAGKEIPGLVLFV